MYPYLTALQNCVWLLEKWHAKWSLSPQGVLGRGPLSRAVQLDSNVEMFAAI